MQRIARQVREVEWSYRSPNHKEYGSADAAAMFNNRNNLEKKS